MKITKLICAAMACLMVLTACGSNTAVPAPQEETPAASAGFTAGTYEATADGFGGPVKIAVTVNAEKITAIEILENSETEQIGGAALPKLVEQAIAKQSLALDGVSSATVSSTAFLAALKDALTQAGGDIESLSKAAESTGEAKETVALTTDVLVVGAGGAGLSTSVTAAQNGAKVLVLEKAPMAGGATAMAGGGTNATGSEAQKSFGIEDSPEQLFSDLMKNGHYYNDARTVWLYANTVGRMFDWISSEDGAGVTYKIAEPKPSAEHSVGRTFSPEGGGGAVVKTLLAKAESLGVEFMYETPAKELIVTDGKVTGVKALAADGTPYEITATSVILATGGYGANPELISDTVKALPYAGSAAATGDGLLMATTIGADKLNMDKVNIQPHSIKLPDGRGQHTYQACLAMYNGTGSILVNEKGERFVNELGSGASIKEAMQQNGRSFLVMDADAFAKYAETAIASHNFTQEQLDKWLEANGTSDPVFAKADTLEALAGIVSIPGDALAASVKKYNEAVAKGTDEEFGRKTSAPMGETDSYYLVEMKLRYYATLGGLRINDNMQVMNTEGAAIEGLYAAGEVVGGLSGDIYIPGGLFGWAMTSGHNAGLAVTGK